MDWQRIFILLGLAVTTYLLILAWNEDYGQANQPPATVEDPLPGYSAGQQNTVPQSGTSPMPAETAPVTATPGADTLSVPPEADLLPTLQDVPSSETTPPPVKTGGDLVEVTTDVFNLLIDPLGGDIVRVALPGFPATLETPDVPFLLVDPRNGYVAQSGLIGPNGTDKPGGRPVYRVDASAYDMGSSDTLTVDLHHIQSDGSEITKRFTFRRGDYLIGVEYLIVRLNDFPDLAGIELFVQNVMPRLKLAKQ